MQDVMSKHAVSIAPEATIRSAREALRREEVEHLIVAEKKHVVGVVAREDLARAKDEDAPITGVMTRNVVTIEPGATLRRAAGVMRGRAIGCLPVVSHGELVGVVTTSDLLDALAKGDTHPGPPDGRVVLRKRGPRKRGALI
jgi:CBS domain-containing protein